MHTARIVTIRKQAVGSVAFVAIAMVAGLATRGAPRGVPVPPSGPRPGMGQPAEEPGQKAVPTATLVVVDRDSNSPLPGATVWVRGKGGPIYTWEGTTDDQGRYTIVPPSEATRWFDVLIAPPPATCRPLSPRPPTPTRRPLPSDSSGRNPSAGSSGTNEDGRSRGLGSCRCSIASRRPGPRSRRAPTAGVPWRRPTPRAAGGPRPYRSAPLRTHRSASG